MTEAIGGDTNREDSPNARFVVEILSWDWNLSVALSSDLTPAEYRFQGGLNYVRNLVVLGRVLEPVAHRGKSIRIWITPFGPEMRFGTDEMDEVGRIYFRPAASSRAELGAMLMLPESALVTTSVSLSSVSKFFLIRTFDTDAEQASVSGYSLTHAPPASVTPWTSDQQG